MWADPALLGEYFDGFVQFYESLKRQYIPRDETVRALLHVHIGLAVWLLLALVSRRKLVSALPLAILWAGTAMTELFDLYSQWPVRKTWVWNHIASDFLHALLWPTLIWLALRIGQRSSKPPANRIPTGKPASGRIDGNVVSPAATAGDEER